MQLSPVSPEQWYWRRYAGCTTCGALAKWPCLDLREQNARNPIARQRRVYGQASTLRRAHKGRPRLPVAGRTV